MSHLFAPFTQKDMTLRNRVVMAPMCMFCSGKEGVPDDWHFVHLSSRAVGGAGLIISEATAVEPQGRISEADLGLWNDGQAAAFQRMAASVKQQGAAFGIQLAHAGRKAWSFTKGNGPALLVAPSPIAYDHDWQTPEALDAAGLDRVVAAFAAAAARAGVLGCDMVEIHAAHGYLISEFLSPLSNRRQDEYGGSLENRARLLRRVYQAVRAAFPAGRPIWVRVNATEWVPGGWNVAESVELSRWMRDWGVDLVDVSSGGNLPQQQIKIEPGYQVPFAEQIRRETGIAVGAVGLITEPAQADELIQSGKADVVLFGRQLLREPYFALRAAHELGHEVQWPKQYLGGKHKAPIRQ